MISTLWSIQDRRSSSYVLDTLIGAQEYALPSHCLPISKSVLWALIFSLYRPARTRVNRIGHRLTHAHGYQLAPKLIGQVYQLFLRYLSRLSLHRQPLIDSGLQFHPLLLLEPHQVLDRVLNIQFRF